MVPTLLETVEKAGPADQNNENKEEGVPADDDGMNDSEYSFERKSAGEDSDAGAEGEPGIGVTSEGNYQCTVMRMHALGIRAPLRTPSQRRSPSTADGLNASPAAVPSGGGANLNTWS